MQRLDDDPDYTLKKVRSMGEVVRYLADVTESLSDTGAASRHTGVTLEDFHAAVKKKTDRPKRIVVREAKAGGGAAAAASVSSGSSRRRTSPLASLPGGYGGTHSSGAGGGRGSWGASLGAAAGGTVSATMSAKQRGKRPATTALPSIPPPVFGGVISDSEDSNDETDGNGGGGGGGGGHERALSAARTDAERSGVRRRRRASTPGSADSAGALLHNATVPAKIVVSSSDTDTNDGVDRVGGDSNDGSLDAAEEAEYAYDDDMPMQSLPSDADADADGGVDCGGNGDDDSPAVADLVAANATAAPGVISNAAKPEVVVVDSDSDVEEERYARGVENGAATRVCAESNGGVADPDAGDDAVEAVGDATDNTVAIDDMVLAAAAAEAEATAATAIPTPTSGCSNDCNTIVCHGQTFTVGQLFLTEKLQTRSANGKFYNVVMRDPNNPKTMVPDRVPVALISVKWNESE